MFKLRNLLLALIASLIVSIPITFFSLTIVAGELSDLVFHPGFWMMYGQSFVWLFASSLSASMLTIMLVLKNR